MMGCGAGARLPWVGEHSAWEKRGRGSLGKDLEGARVRRIFQTDWASPTPLAVQKPRG